MARIRTIKIGFYKNEHLAELSPTHRLCFIGLWLLADREGRLEDRPIRIKGELFPYETVDVNAILDDLEGGHFVTRYAADDVRYLQIEKFAKHQRPKSDEPESVIPACIYDVPRGIGAGPRISELGREGKGKEGKGEGVGADAPAADVAEALRMRWNTLTLHPIPRCRDLTSKRRRCAKARATERPLTEWEEVFARIQASAFCAGQNERGWVATFDWAIGTPDVAVKVLEGKYDNRAAVKPRPAPTAQATLGSGHGDFMAGYWKTRCAELHGGACESSKQHYDRVSEEEKQKVSA
jgi:hypothetical protein